MRQFAETDDGKSFFGFIQQTVRFGSISAIAKSTIGQMAFISHSIKLHNAEIDRRKKAQDEYNQLMQDVARVEGMEQQFRQGFEGGGFS
ncbi:MAG: hypothetical protein ACXAC2_00075 [Candidatus Kariarchaeaceae archaeon]|jgi:hypothetical protein